MIMLTISPLPRNKLSKSGKFPEYGIFFTFLAYSYNISKITQKTMYDNEMFTELVNK